MSLNLEDKNPSPNSRYYSSPTYTEAVNDAQFVRQFGIAALVTFVLMLILPGIIIGVGLAVLGFGKTSYYRGLGLAIVITSFLNPILGSTILCIGIGWKGIDVLNTLAREGKGDPDWEETRKRAIVGIVFSAVVLLANAAWVTLLLIRFLTGGRN